uniref:L27 domain-containing protein n=1 Tax=Rhabditophanes sp. KR3021 TaxID=114890 RepID=A0AC35TMS5_9BILA
MVNHSGGTQGFGNNQSTRSSAELLKTLEMAVEEESRKTICNQLLKSQILMRELKSNRMIHRLLKLMKEIDQSENIFGCYNALLQRYCNLLNFRPNIPAEDHERLWKEYMNDLKIIYGPSICSGNINEKIEEKASKYSVNIPCPVIARASSINVNARVLRDQSNMLTQPSEINVQCSMIMNRTNDADGEENDFFACPVDPNEPTFRTNHALSIISTKKHGPIADSNHVPSISSSNQQVAIVDPNQAMCRISDIQQVTSDDINGDPPLTASTKQPQDKENRREVNSVSKPVDENVESINGVIEKPSGELHGFINVKSSRHSVLDDFLEEHFQSREALELYEDL